MDLPCLWVEAPEGFAALVIGDLDVDWSKSGQA